MSAYCDLVECKHFVVLLLGDSEKPRTGYACEGGTLNIQCGENRRINIIRANYGRLNIAICNDNGVTQGWQTDCMSPRSLRMVEQMYV